MYKLLFEVIEDPGHRPHMVMNTGSTSFHALKDQFIPSESPRFRATRPGTRLDAEEGLHIILGALVVPSMVFLHSATRFIDFAQSSG